MRSPGTGKSITWRPPSGTDLVGAGPALEQDEGVVIPLPLVDQVGAGGDRAAPRLELGQGRELALAQLHEPGQLPHERALGRRHRQAPT